MNTLDLKGINPSAIISALKEANVDFKELLAELKKMHQESDIQSAKEAMKDIEAKADLMIAFYKHRAMLMRKFYDELVAQKFTTQETLHITISEFLKTGLLI